MAVIYYKKSGKSKYFTLLPLFGIIITDVLIYLTGERTAISLMFKKPRIYFNYIFK